VALTVQLFGIHAKKIGRIKRRSPYLGNDYRSQVHKHRAELRAQIRIIGLYGKNLRFNDFGFQRVNTAPERDAVIRFGGSNGFQINPSYVQAS